MIADRYRLRSRIGAGAMGVVWRAVDERLDRTVAVKQLLLPPGLNQREAETARQRAFREGRMAARLQHPNAITVYNVAEDEGQPVLVMEFLPSRSMADLLAGGRLLPPAEVARLGAQVASALGAAHAAGVVHRDVKPGNVLIAEDGTAKITDFGISRAAGDVTLTSTGLFAGTPAYLSPEAARGADPGPPSDVFSLGATLYSLVEGGPPFGTLDNEIALLHKVATSAATPPRQAGPLTGPLQAMLHQDAAERPAMVEVEAALRAVAAGAAPQLEPATVPAVAPVTAPMPATPAVAPAATTVSAAQQRPATRVGLPTVEPERPGRDRTRIALVAAAVLAAVAAGVLVSEILVRTVGASGSEAGASPGTSAPASVSRSVETPATSTRPQPSRAELEAAVARYYALVPDDADTAWGSLGPTLHAQGKEQYGEFWDGIEKVEISGGPRAVGDETVKVRLDFETTDGDRTREMHRLGMTVSAAGDPLIDTDEVLSTRDLKGKGDGGSGEGEKDEKKRENKKGEDKADEKKDEKDDE
ncbi:hypothetical protein GCM10009675_02610 [Prauserella alba]|uniref:non-specific serine/threonine protein kinase n=1 Tax=Prauserella alba TaxID=176898 RepID=A0ABP4FMG7_9PSEU